MLAPFSKLATLLTIPAILAATTAVADDTAPADSSTVTAAATQASAKPSEEGQHLTYLVPALEGAGYRLNNGRPQFKSRLSFSPGFGQLGAQDLFSFRVGFSPNSWLAYEIALGHNPTESLHAVLHTFNVILRYPIPWRLQPYATLGYGMMTVYPGAAINADPVTKNTLTAGGGLEFYVRDDVAIRGEIRDATVVGRELNKDGTVAYSYREYTLGFAFYRGLGK
jgi:opacity protein-like surface antigen